MAAGVAAVVVALDQLTKEWAIGRLATGPCSPETCIDVVGTLRFHRVDNPGAAFSIGQNLPLGPVLTLIGLAMSVVLVFLAGRNRRLGFSVVAGMITGGALGNVADRIARTDGGFGNGHVVDFIDLQWWPVFNVADMAIVVGIGIIALFGRHLYPTNEPADQ